MTALAVASRRPTPLLAASMLVLLTALWAGLRRIGWGLPYVDPHLVPAHGPLMVVGFLGTLIGVERAVAARRPWGYLAPTATAATAPALFLEPITLAAVLASAGSAVFFALTIHFFRRQRTLFNGVMAAGGLALLGGNLSWCTGAPLYRVVPWWSAFVLLTIVGERLEMTRLLPHSRRVTTVFLAAAALYVVGLASASWLPLAGPRLRGIGMIALALWLLRNDIARRTIRQEGLPRFIAACLLAGYAWLVVAGLLAVVDGDLPAGARYDAAVHALMLGFVFSMIFAHAPVIFPAVAGIDVPFRRRFYAHAALLHLGLAVRVMGDLLPAEPVRAWGGMLGAAAILLFLGSTAGAARRGLTRA